MNIRSLLMLIAFIALCQATGLLGVMSGETGNSAWYQALNKPPFNPPPWVFAPAWITLYTVMAIAAWRVWRTDKATAPGRRNALGLFALQLVLNGAWTPVFFGAHEPGWALLVICALLVTLLVTTRSFARIDRAAAWLMAPYIAWVAFATLLNASIWVLN